MSVRNRNQCLAMVGLMLLPLGTALAAQTAPAPDADVAAGDVTRAVFIATMDAEFRRRDADGDAIISRSELEQFALAEAVAAARLANRNLFVQLDRDANGVLSPDEFAGLVAPPVSPDISGQLAQLDRNGDQRVALIEYRAATQANFDRLDTDLDGVVTTAEMQAARSQPEGR